MKGLGEYFHILYFIKMPSIMFMGTNATWKQYFWAMFFMIHPVYLSHILYNDLGKQQNRYYTFPIGKIPYFILFQSQHMALDSDIQ